MMSFFKIRILLIVLCCSTIASDPFNDCKSAVVVGFGQNTLIDFIGQLSVNFAQNRTDSNVFSKVAYFAKPFTEAKSAILASSDDPPIFMVSTLNWITVETKAKYPDLKIAPITAV